MGGHNREALEERQQKKKFKRLTMRQAAKLCTLEVCLESNRRFSQYGTRAK